MDILAYTDMKENLKAYNEYKGKPYGNVIVSYATTNTTYPHTVFAEIRNVDNPLFNSFKDKVASVGYRIDVYAKTKGKVDKQTIARVIAKEMDTYLDSINLQQISFNEGFEGQDMAICHITITYSGNLLEDRRILI